ncbi:MAG TPA: ATP-grasp domain-containing protein [Rhizomicrobium sp.]|jgi:predicted ATP-grasp superfamily ATP-dependent carboligase
MTHKVLLSATVGWPSVARYAGGFAAAGCQVHALSPAGAPVCVSRYVTRHHRYRAFGSSLAKAIADAQPDLIVACDDRAVAQMLALYRESKPGSAVAQIIARSLGTPENYGRVVSRYGSLSELRELGVRVPDTFPANSEAELEAALANTGFPAVLKSDGSWGGEGVIVARNREDARAAFHKLSTPPSRLRSLVRAARRKDAHHLLAAFAPQSHSICVQQFIAGKAANSAFAAWNGEVVGTVYYDVLMADALIGPPNVIRRTDCPQIDRASHLVAKRFGLSGLHGIDFIRDDSGTAYAIEINPRATQGGTLAFGPGHDLPAALVSAAFSAAATMRDAIANDVVTLFPREWRRDPDSNWLKSGHHDVPWDDPAVLMATMGKTPLPNKAAIARAIAQRSLSALVAQ